MLPKSHSHLTIWSARDDFNKMILARTISSTNLFTRDKFGPILSIYMITSTKQHQTMTAWSQRSQNTDSNSAQILNPETSTESITEVPIPMTFSCGMTPIRKVIISGSISKWHLSISHSSESELALWISRKRRVCIPQGCEFITRVRNEKMALRPNFRGRNVALRFTTVEHFYESLPNQVNQSLNTFISWVLSST